MYKVKHIDNKHKLTYRKMIPEYITIHSTGNLKSTAQNERDNLNRPENTEPTGFHIVVDEKEVIECMPLDNVAYHAGDGREGKGNTKSIGIEICESGDREKTLNNAKILVANMLKERGWKIDRLKRHFDWSGKNCPSILNYNNWEGWTKFLNDIKDMIDIDKNVIDVDRIKDWEREQGQEAIRSLADKGVINNPDLWIDKLDGAHIADWAIWSLLNRIADRNDKPNK